MVMAKHSISPSVRLAQAIDQVVQPPKENTWSKTEKQAIFARIKTLCEQQDAVIIAHYYVDALIQELAEQSDGFIGDSLEMARFGARHPASTLIVAGVHFMGETAKILSPEKRVLVPDIEATCSLDLGCPADEFSAFCDAHPERTVVVYANTSAAVKARADWVVTSSIALDVIRHLDDNGEAILWAPDRHLGHYIQQQTGADMLLWDGACIVHETFKATALKNLKQAYPDAAILVHPESPAAVVAMADVVGSTTQLLNASQALPDKTFIVATERGIFYKMQQRSPDKTFIQAPSGGAGATCRSCIHCPWMAQNDLTKVEQVLLNPVNEIQVDPELAQRALVGLDKMVSFIAGK